MALICNTDLIFNKFVYKKGKNEYTIIGDADLALVLREQYGYLGINRDYVKNFRKKHGIKSCREGLQQCTDLKRLHYLCVQNLSEMFGKHEPTGDLAFQTLNIKKMDGKNYNLEEKLKRVRKPEITDTWEISNLKKYIGTIKKQDGQGLLEFGFIIAVISALIILLFK